MSVVSASAAAETLYFEDRADIPEQYTWDLSLYVEDAEAWDEAFADIEARIPEFARYKGKVADSPAAMAAATSESATSEAELRAIFEALDAVVHTEPSVGDYDQTF